MKTTMDSHQVLAEYDQNVDGGGQMYKILLLEPDYRNRYPPLGLMKLAQYHRIKGDEVVFEKGTPKKLKATEWDRIYITTLFSFEFKRIAKTIDFALSLTTPQKIFVGGIAASLMHEQFQTEPRWEGIRFIKGLLDAPPAQALQLKQELGDFHADDLNSKPIEDLAPDYEILTQIEYKYAVEDAYFGYASRGCVRKCHFCGVPKLEGEQRDSMSISQLIKEVDAQSPNGEQKRDLLLMDNNITASPRFKEIIAEIKDNGFQAGATLTRNGRKLMRKVDFNQGVDARILAKDAFYMREISQIAIKPLRIAFDHLGLRKAYTRSVEYASEFGVVHLSNYMLYNFYDTPYDLYERLRINVDLNQKHGVRIWSFPMRYQPVDRKDRGHIGKNWTWYQLRSFQVILNATRGVVSGNPEYFFHAFGESQQNFQKLLLLPHRMIFHRNHYAIGDGAAEREEFENQMHRLSESQSHDLLNALTTVKATSPKEYEGLACHSSDHAVRRVLAFYTETNATAASMNHKTPDEKVVPLTMGIDPAFSHGRFAMDDDEAHPDAGIIDNEIQSSKKTG